MENLSALNPTQAEQLRTCRITATNAAGGRAPAQRQPRERNHTTMRADRPNFSARLEKAGFRLSGDIFGTGIVGPMTQGKRK